MRSYEALRKLVEHGGESMRNTSKAVGKSANYIYTTIYKKSDSQAQTIAAIARECGYRLALVPEPEELPPGSIEID